MQIACRIGLLGLPLAAMLFAACDSGPTPKQIEAQRQRAQAFRQAHASTIAFCERSGVSRASLELTIAFSSGKDHAIAEYELKRLAAKRIYAESLDQAVRQLSADFEEPALPFHVWNAQDTEKMRRAGLTDEEIDEMWNEARLYARPEFRGLVREQRIRFIAGQM